MIDLELVYQARSRLDQVSVKTPLQRASHYSQRLGAEIFFKREDLQPVRSYKLRGAYNKIASLSTEERAKGVACASAGNHAQGFAYACSHLKIHGDIFMPLTTPRQKIRQVERFGEDNVVIHLEGDTFDDAQRAVDTFVGKKGPIPIPPFDDNEVIAGQGTLSLEIIEEMKEPIDYLFLPIGGGGVASGAVSVFRRLSPSTKLIGFEPKGAPSLTESMRAGKNIKLTSIDKFIDGAAVQKMGEKTFDICQQGLDGVYLIDEGAACSEILNLYDEEAIIAEPAGALSVAGLTLLQEQIQGKRVVALISGGNNDIRRMEEIKERSLLHRGLRHYYILALPQRPGALRELVADCLEEEDDIIFFEYTKKNSRERGLVTVGFELRRRENFPRLHKALEERGMVNVYLNENPELMHYLL